jgi:type II secretory pathway component PulK
MRDQARNATRGVALVMALVVAVLIESLTLLALHAAIIHVRLVADERQRIEGQLVVSTALANARVAYRADLDTMSDGGVLDPPAVTRVDGWSWRAQATRAGAVIRLVAVAERRSADGTVFAAHRASLLLARDSADTVRVLGHRPRF